MIQDVSESLRLDSYNQNKAKYTKLKKWFCYGLGEFTGETKDFNSYMRTQDFGFMQLQRSLTQRVYTELKVVESIMVSV